MGCPIVCRFSHPLLLAFVLLASNEVVVAAREAAVRPVDARRTLIVRAVERARPSVVNINGHKTIRAKLDMSEGTETHRQVNGMGTGVVIDQRGYIVTNHHVVEGVRRIQVTLADGKSYLAKRISHDPQTDLALIKINAPVEIPIITMGKSSDLMPGEPVVAVGNAYGYQHTVTRGVISAVGRWVEISDSQTYKNLIQTDASINPGNSGGPLLNVEGEMIGVNVAVRSGAQGIGFAIPVDTVLNITANLLSVRRLQNCWHGVVTKPLEESSARLVVDRVETNSPADKGGLRPGDQITSVGHHDVVRRLDFERALLGRKSGEPIKVTVERGNRSLTLNLVLATLPASFRPISERVWEQLGLKLYPAPPEKFGKLRTRYRGGLIVSAVRADSPADQQGIRQGDMLVGMHIWETVSRKNLAYILNQLDLDQARLVKFYILRGGETFYGRLSLASRDERDRS